MSLAVSRPTAAQIQPEAIFSLFSSLPCAVMERWARRPEEATWQDLLSQGDDGSSRPLVSLFFLFTDDEMKVSAWPCSTSSITAGPGALYNHQLLSCQRKIYGKVFRMTAFAFESSSWNYTLIFLNYCPGSWVGRQRKEEKKGSFWLWNWDVSLWNCTFYCPNGLLKVKKHKIYTVSEQIAHTFTTINNIFFIIINITSRKHCCKGS